MAAWSQPSLHLWQPLAHAWPGGQVKQIWFSPDGNFTRTSQVTDPGPTAKYSPSTLAWVRALISAVCWQGPGMCPQKQRVLIKGLDHFVPYVLGGSWQKWSLEGEDG